MKLEFGSSKYYSEKGELIPLCLGMRDDDQEVGSLELNGRILY